MRRAPVSAGARRAPSAVPPSAPPSPSERRFGPVAWAATGTEVRLARARAMKRFRPRLATWAIRDSRPLHPIVPQKAFRSRVELGPRAPFLAAHGFGDLGDHFTPSRGHV